MNGVFHSDMPTVLITGINGFTGRYLAEELRAAGYTVAGISHDVPEAGKGGVFRCNLHDRDALAEVLGQIQPDIVVHLAAISFVANGDVEAIYRTNVIGTRNLLEAVSSCGQIPRSILLASSANVYGNTTVEYINESVPVAPANDYAVSKLAMEYMARLWLDRLPITIVRPFNYTGVGQAEDFLLPKIVSHFKRRAPVIELGNLDVVRDFSDVRSVVHYYRLLLETESPCEVFNICSGQGHSLMDVLEMMREISSYSPEVHVNPAFVRANEVRKLVGSRAKLQKWIGPVADIPLRDTLNWMYKALEA